MKAKSFGILQKLEKKVVFSFMKTFGKISLKNMRSYQKPKKLYKNFVKIILMMI